MEFEVSIMSLLGVRVLPDARLGDTYQEHTKPSIKQLTHSSGRIPPQTFFLKRHVMHPRCGLLYLLSDGQLFFAQLLHGSAGVGDDTDESGR